MHEVSHHPLSLVYSTERSGLSSAATVMNLVIAHDEPYNNASPILSRCGLAHCAL
jgi:hypothetical protein